MKGISSNRVRRFLSRIFLTATLLIVLATFQQACSQSVEVVAGGGSVEDVQVASEVDSNSTQPPQLEAVGSPQDLSVEVRKLIDQFREKLQFEWDSSSPTMSSPLKTELTGIVDAAYKKAAELSENDPQRARAAFYFSYWQDLQERVLEPISQCRKASTLYGEAIRLYKKVYGSDSQNISNEEAYIIIEMSHWLTNRDAGPDHYGDFDGYAEALKLLDILASNQSFGEGIKYNILVSRGVAIFGQKKNYVAAAAAFRAALELYPESSDVTYNWGSMEAYQGNFTQAITHYNSAIEKSGFSRLTPDIVKRDLGFAYILQEMIEDPSGQSSRYDRAVNYFNEIIQSSSADTSLKELAHIGKSLALHHMDKITEANVELAEAGSSDFAKYVEEMIDNREKNNPAVIDLIKEVSFGNIVPHDQEEDPVLDIFHNLFYCSDGDIRIN